MRPGTKAGGLKALKVIWIDSMDQFTCRVYLAVEFPKSCASFETGYKWYVIICFKGAGGPRPWDGQNRVFYCS